MKIKITFESESERVSMEASGPEVERAIVIVRRVIEEALVRQMADAGENILQKEGDA